MKIISLLAASALSFVNAQTNWTFERQGLTAVLSDSRMEGTPLRLSCAQQGYLEIDILSGAENAKPNAGLNGTVLAVAATSREVTLVGPSNMRLTLQGKPSSDGRFISRAYFKSLTAEFLREEGEVEVVGAKSYRINLEGARRVLDTLQSSCLAVT
jgi:hypothetical protein